MVLIYRYDESRSHLESLGMFFTTRARRAAAIVPALAAALVLSSCAPAAAPESDGTLRVVATTTQLTDFASEVGGDDISLTGLLPIGGSAHHFDPSPKELLALGEADVLIVNGGGLETFIDSTVEASGFSGTIITAADGIDLDEAKRITAEGEHEAEGTEHADEAHGEHDHDDHDGHEHAAEGDEHGHEGHDHDHGDTNPHLWTSPRYASDMVSEIARGLSEADPAHAKVFGERAEAYEAKLAELDTWVGEQFERVPEADRVLVTGHDSLRYFLHDYDIAYAGAIMPSFEDNAEPSAAELDALAARIKERGVRAIFVESSMSPKLARTIAREAGVTVVDGDTLYADSLGAAGSGAENYIDATVHNTGVILAAWGASMDAVPADLGGDE